MNKTEARIQERINTEKQVLRQYLEELKGYVDDVEMGRYGRGDSMVSYANQVGNSCHIIMALQNI